jgi:dUTP pyrophosphatase
MIQFINNLIFGNSNLEFVRVRDVKAPERGTMLSAGLDFFLPNDAEPITIGPNESALIPSGIHVKFNPRYVLIGFNKSGVAAKKKLLIGAQVIDADYQGEMHINLHNVGDQVITFNPGDKLTQFIMLRVGLGSTRELKSLKDLYGEKETERGNGGFGSTGTR